jgi:hypothetical protein
MLKSALQYLLNASGYVVLSMIIIFPLLSFKISASSAIFPALDVIIIYYLVCNCEVRILKILLISPFIDQLYAFPLGCSTVAFIIGQLAFKLVGKWFLVKEYISNFLLFCTYCFVIFTARYFIFTVQGLYLSLFELAFLYLITIFSYPLSQIVLDKISSLFSLKA